jgi:hypothetical protein
MNDNDDDELVKKSQELIRNSQDISEDILKQFTNGKIGYEGIVEQIDGDMLLMAFIAAAFGNLDKEAAGHLIGAIAYEEVRGNTQ